jgi:hypothetical protein
MSPLSEFQFLRRALGLGRLVSNGSNSTAVRSGSSNWSPATTLARFADRSPSDGSSHVDSYLNIPTGVFNTFCSILFNDFNGLFRRPVCDLTVTVRQFRSDRPRRPPATNFR